MKIRIGGHGFEYNGEIKEVAQEIADTINRHHCNGNHATRFYKVVPSDYVLQPGFEP